MGTLLRGAIAVLILATLCPLLWADDETDDLSIELQGTLQSIDALAVPPTITVLGLTIQVDLARFRTDTGQTLADLTTGQPVKVEFFNDITPLSASKVDQRSGLSADSKIQGAIQAIDTSGQTITLLGQSVDLSSAIMVGRDDDGDVNDHDSNPADDNLPILLSALIVGQFVEVELESGSLPSLVASDLHLNNSTNQVEVQLLDVDGVEVNDLLEDVQIEAECQSKVFDDSTGTTIKVKKFYPISTASQGSFILTGLPTGKIGLTVTRTVGPEITRKFKKVGVKANLHKQIRIKLRLFVP